jgi:hypothetical protein
MIEVKEETDGTFTISWDENDPVESILNTWSEEDFKKAIETNLIKLMEEENKI